MNTLYLATYTLIKLWNCVGIYDIIQDLTYVWRTRACENYLGIKIIKNDTQSNVFWGNFECTFWFWHLKASVMCFFFEIFAILRPKMAKNHHFGVTYFLTLHIEAWKSSIHTTSYWYFLTLNDKIGTSLFFFNYLNNCILFLLVFRASTRLTLKLHGVLPFSSNFDLWMTINWQWNTLYCWFWSQFVQNFNRNILGLNLASFVSIWEIYCVKHYPYPLFF